MSFYLRVFFTEHPFFGGTFPRGGTDPPLGNVPPKEKI